MFVVYIYRVYTCILIRVFFHIAVFFDVFFDFEEMASV